jgi:hypothetical protein
LIEQGAAPLLGTIALGLARAFNGEDPLAPSSQPCSPNPFSLALKKLADHVLADMNEIASIPKRDLLSDPLEREFSRILEENVEDMILREWWRRVRNPHSDLGRLRRLAVIFHRELQNQRSAIPGLSRVAEMVFPVIEAIPKQPFVRPKGDHRYPGLDHLVQAVESSAKLAGGKGFGMPTKKPQKGRILQFLDRLRVRFKNDPELEWLAEFLPLPGRHPISIYHRAIRDARTDVASERAGLAAELAAEAADLLEEAAKPAPPTLQHHGYLELLDSQQTVLARLAVQFEFNGDGSGSVLLPDPDNIVGAPGVPKSSRLVDQSGVVLQTFKIDNSWIG